MTDGRPRLEALDVFRGLTVAAMILVSTPGTWAAVYAPLDHAAWNGWTPTDLVFPFFLFAMGAAVPFAIARRRDAAARVHTHVLRRTSLLFLLGMLLNAIETPPPLVLASFRIPGVLQRIAIVYFVVAVVTDRLTRRQQVAVALAALAGYWLAMTAVPVPGIGPGVLTPTGNLASYLDRRLLGRHMLTPQVDPEGLLSTIPAIATALCGVFTGERLRRRTGADSTLLLIIAGIGATIAGLAWGRIFPINKTLWTSSFALFSAGLAALVLAACHWLIDVRGWRRIGLPFVAFGRNALAAYFLSVGLDSVLTRWSVPTALSLKALIYRDGFASWIRPCCGAEAASLAYAVAYVAAWQIVLAIMYRRRIFIAV